MFNIKFDRVYKGRKIDGSKKNDPQRVGQGKNNGFVRINSR